MERAVFKLSVICKHTALNKQSINPEKKVSLPWIKKYNICLINYFEQISINKTTNLERKRAIKSLIFLNKIRDNTIEDQIWANGNTQRVFFCKEATSLTAALEAIITIGVIDVKHKRDVLTSDIPNSFVQTDIALYGDKIIMKIRGQLVNIFI